MSSHLAYIKSIIQSLGSKDFVRVRIGVARTSFWTGKTVRPSGAGLNKHVLGKFTSGERKQLEVVYKEVAEALEMIVTDSLSKAMNQFNKLVEIARN